MAKPKDNGPYLRHVNYPNTKVQFCSWISDDTFFFQFGAKGAKYRGYQHLFEASTDRKNWKPVAEVFPQ